MSIKYALSLADFSCSSRPAIILNTTCSRFKAVSMATISVKGKSVATNEQRPDKPATFLRYLNNSATRQIATIARNQTLASCADSSDINRSTGIAYKIAGGDVKDTKRSTFL